VRILYLTLENLSLHKGSVVHVKEIVNGLRKLGHHVGLVASSLNKSEEADRFYNLNVIPSFMLRLFRLKKQPYIVSLIFLFLYLLRILPQYDIIYARDYHTVIAAFFPRLIFKKKLVFEINGIANEEQRLKSHSILNRILVFFIREAEKMATRCSDRIVSVTPQIVSYLMTNFYDHPNKVWVIGNGVDIKKFHPMHDEALLRERKERLGIEKEEVVIAFVGNLARWQGVGVLIESAIGLLSRGKKLKLLLVGDGPLKGELMRKVMGSGFSKEFIFTGMIRYEDIPILINLADICVAPFISRRNRTTGVSPLKVFEYMACGKPVVASRVEGLEFIEGEGVGLLTEPEDVIGFEKALLDLINEPHKRTNMGQKAAQIARERFSWESRVTEIENEIEKVLKELA
jgi:glycosyltransferase involved in cell wall biosynthesis